MSDTWEKTWGIVSWGKLEDVVLSDIRSLLDKGADVNMTDKDGNSVLARACLYYYENTVKLLLEKGADPNKRNKDEETSLMWLFPREEKNDPFFNITHLLLKYGADINAVDKDGRTQLMNIVKSDNPEVIFFLVKHGADIHLKDNKDKTLLMEALENSAVWNVRLLIQLGADTKAKDKYGTTTFHYIPKYKSTELVPLLKNADRIRSNYLQYQEKALFKGTSSRKERAELLVKAGKLIDHDTRRLVAKRLKEKEFYYM